MYFTKTDKPLKVEYTAQLDPPKIYIDTMALIKMNSYVQQCSEEISWLGIVTKSEDHYFIEDVMLFEQEVSAVTADICEKALSDFGTKLLQNGQFDLFNKIRCWGHSHVNMDVFASGTDEATFKQFYENSDYFIRIITNKKGKMSVDLVDNVSNVRYLNLDWIEFYSDQIADIIDRINKAEGELVEISNQVNVAAKSEIDRCIKKKTYNYSSPSYTNHKSKWINGDYDYYGDYAYYGYQEKFDIPETKLENKVPESVNPDENDVYNVYIWDEETKMELPVDIEDALEFDLIASCSDPSFTWKSLRAELYKDKRYAMYNNTDWMDLYYLAKEYYEDLLTYEYIVEEEEKDGSNGLQETA